MDRRRIDPQELAARIDEQADRSAARIRHQKPCTHIEGRTLETEARTHVDGRDDLTAREHDAVDERRGVGDTRDRFDQVDVRNLAARQGVGRTCDYEQDVLIGVLIRHAVSLT
jgi:hypothetical protein